MTKTLTGSTPSSRPSPHGNPVVANAEDLQQDLKDASFDNVTRSPFDYPLEIDLSDLIQMVAGPHGLFASMLAKMKDDGRRDVQQEAAQVSFLLQCHNGIDSRRVCMNAGIIASCWPRQYVS